MYTSSMSPCCPTHQLISGPGSVCTPGMARVGQRPAIQSMCLGKKLLALSRLHSATVLSGNITLLTNLQPILRPISILSRPAFLIMISLYKLYRYGDSIHPCLTPFPIKNGSVSPKSVHTLTVDLHIIFLLIIC